MEFLLISGEASGDLHGADLIREIRKRLPDSSFRFFGGDRMATAAGHDPIVHQRDMAFMGFSAVLKNLPRIRRNFRIAEAEICTKRPDALILIDYPGFNLKMARLAHSLGIPVYYYIPPKVWAWKQWRVKSLLKYCRKILCIFPFEPAFFEKIAAEEVRDRVLYVGNPSVGEVARQLHDAPSRQDFLDRWHMRARRPLIALMPGSRQGEIRANLPVMAQAMDPLTQYKPVIVGAPDIPDDFYTALLNGREIPVLRVKSAPDVLCHSRAAVVTSGTATLEVALCSVPQVAVYRSNGSKIAYELMKRVLNIPFVTLPNLICGRRIIPELLLHHCTPEAITTILTQLLPETAELRKEQMVSYADMASILGNSCAAEQAANTILSDLNEI